VGGTATLPGTFVARAPARVLDTRTASAVGANADYSVTILGRGAIPATRVSAVVINTIVGETKAPSHLTLFAGSSSLPIASNLHWGGVGSTVPNMVTTQIGSDGTIKFHNRSGGTQVIADTPDYYVSY
jgi:hypothetical protein